MSLRDILRAAIEDRAQPWAPSELPEAARAIDRGPGLIELLPARSIPSAAASVLSAGIHGNETAPIELLLDLADAIDTGRVIVAAPILLVIGHPAAIVAGQRYLKTNLNRLFVRERGALAAGSHEHQRADRLMDAIDAFWRDHRAPPVASAAATPMHLDLHTAIRASRYPRFVVEPAGGSATPNSVWQAAAGAGLQAVLFQQTDSPTFSHYSRAEHGIIAFTIELGRVAPFGENDLAALAPMAAWLAARVAGCESEPGAVEAMDYFTVADELYRTGDDFALGFDENVANFTAFDVGTTIARDAVAGDTVVRDAPVHVVFPNAAVERGARAALLVRPIAPPGHDNA